MNDDIVIESTRRWISEVVIGLNLCPFARRVMMDAKIRYVVSEASEPDALLADLARELAALVDDADAVIETTLIIHPHLFADFLDYNDFLADADEHLSMLGYEGIIQIASFHPQYRFADTKPNAVENYTNRSPYAMLHLLRESSVSAVVDYPGGLEAIPKRNIAALRKLGLTTMRAKLKDLEMGTE